jgi:ATP-dependent DNA ligase
VDGPPSPTRAVMDTGTLAWIPAVLRASQLPLPAEFVIGGYTPSAKNFDAMVIGYYKADKLIYSARVRNGFTPSSRVKLFEKIKPLEIDKCPFANLPEQKSGRWGAGLTAAKMKDCGWIKPVLVGQFEFLEWSGDHLRHPHFVAFRDDKKPKQVVKED